MVGHSKFVNALDTNMNESNAIVWLALFKRSVHSISIVNNCYTSLSSATDLTGESLQEKCLGLFRHCAQIGLCAVYVECHSSTSTDV